MRAALLTTLGRPLELAEVSPPKPASDEILVEVEACGVCHSDLHLAAGDWPDCAARMAFPATLGHEAVGRVVERGSRAADIAIGTRVGVGWLRSVCGRCEHCLAGAENVCLARTVTGIEGPGGFAALIPVLASQAVAIPEGLPSHEAAPLFCAGLTVYHAARLAGISAGQRVAVFGVGGLGHLAIQIARVAGADVVAVDVHPSKLDLARKVGASAALDARDAASVEALKAAGGPHVALVTAPSAEAYRLATRVLRRRGTLAVVGLPKEDLTFFADDLAVGEFRIVGSAVGTRQETRELLALAASGRIRCETEVLPLDGVNDVFDRMRRGEIAGRAVLRMGR
ncbi:MAG: zinc-dependent alcohol dehydrogenase [Acidobacteria bacterium]|nr:zinc-dependent alcohol dehydrogenase [Acidobacteriota bacterium]